MRILKSSLRSPLIRRIAVVVFACILAIEAVLLVTSYFSERQRLMAHVATAAEMLAPAFIDEDPVTLARLMDNPHARYPLIGYRIDRLGREPVMAGRQTPDIRPDSVAWSYQDGEQSHFIVRRALPDGASATDRLTLIFDVRAIEAAMRAYVLRIVGLVVLITAFVTAGTLIALGPILLTPLLRLRRLLRSAGHPDLPRQPPPIEQLSRTDEIGDVYRAFDLMLDSLDRSQAENREVAARFQDFASLGADCFWELDQNLRLRFIAGDLQNLFSCSPECLRDLSLRTLLRERGLSARQARVLIRAVREDGYWDGHFEPDHGGEHRLFVRVTARVILDQDGRLRAVRGIIADITAESLMATELEHLAAHDALTGLLNRRAFDGHVTHALEARNTRDTPATLCVLDLDRFKAVNDQCGHAAGDALLRQVADLLHRHIRQGDLAARIGGDEFALLLTGCRLAQGMRIAETIRHAISRFRFDWQGSRHDIGVSIGVAELDPMLGQAADMMRAADACCIKAKQAGRNQVRVFRPQDQDDSAERASITCMNQIGSALEHRRFELYYQPAVDLAQTVNGEFPAESPSPYYEILVRMRTEDGRLLAPGAFLPTAERHRLIESIDRHVVERVFGWLSRHGGVIDSKTTIAINLSAASVANASFRTFVAESLQNSGIDPSRLCYEISETATVHDISGSVRFLNAMRDLGSRVAIDDFGTGLSSLEHLKHLPIDYVKIDGAFVREIARNAIDRSMVECVVKIAELIGVTTIAEEVSDATIAAALRSAGVRFAQGFWYAEPLPLDSVLKARANPALETPRALSPEI
ncbi:MAG: EAL domain-containing protein [Burkholderiaceae bacterium]